MTLIVGLNLSDRIYIGADTRVSFKDNDTKKDDIIKIAPLSEVHGSPILVAVAGNLKLAIYLYNHIKTAINQKNLTDDIRILSNHITDFVLKLYDNWLQEGNSYNACCLIFGGMCSKRKKQISFEKLESLKSCIVDTPVPVEIGNQMMSTVVAQQFLKKGINLLEILNKPKTQHVSTIVQKAIETNNSELDCSDSLVFGLTISKNGIEIQKAEWGEFLAYGTNGISKNNFSEDFLARMEIPSGEVQKDLNETLLIRDEIMHIAKELNIEGIGGIVTPAVIRDNNYKYCFEHQRNSLDKYVENIETVYSTSDGFFFKKGQGTPIKLVNFFEYKIDNIPLSSLMI